ncbi:GSCOCG00010246001-RA-CDS [Cotesia congregata]|nr:GSCOCG00010246001-RA-CDS [Cotesia congregata]
MANDNEHPYIKQLNARAKVDLSDKKIQDVAKRLPKMFEEGLKFKRAGNDDMLYVMMKRYLDSVAWVQKNRLYNSNSNEYQQYIVPRHVEEAKTTIDSLSIKFEESHKQQQQQQQVIVKPKIKSEEKEPDDETYLDKISSLPDIPDDEPLNNNVVINNNNNNNNNVEKNEFMTCTDLYNVIDSNKTLVLDVRSHDDYLLSKIKSRKCVNIPEECIKLGTLAKNYTHYIVDPKEISFYEDRSVKFINILVLVDWSTTPETLKLSSPIALMAKILRDWDPGTTKAEILMLKGGFKEWLDTYPTWVTDPNVTCPSERNHPEYDIPPIDFPSFQKERPPAPKRTPINNSLNDLDISRLSQGFDKMDIDTNINSYHDSNDDRKIKTVKPPIDRTKKPADKDPEIVQYFETLKQRNCLAEDQEKLEKQLWHLEQQLFDVIKIGGDGEELKDEKDVVKKTLDKILQDKKKNKSELIEKKSLVKNKLKNVTSEETKLDLRFGDIENRIKETQLKREEVIKKLDKLLKERDALKINKANNYDSEIYKEPLKSEESTLTINSDLKRSLSSPNLAQVKKIKLTKDFENLKIPTFDRSSKPTDVRKNNYDNSRSKKSVDDSNLSHMKPVFMDGVQQGTTGLKNLGNSCYMSSIIQCLSNTPILSNYFRNNSYEDDLHRNGNYGKNSKLVTAFAQVIKSLWTSTIRHISPIELKSTLGSLSNEFGTNEQQDSHEFLILLLEWMHLALRTDDKKIPRDTQMTEAEKQYEQSLEGKRSVLTELFNGQSCSTCTCMHCGFQSITYETFNSLTLSVPENAPCSLSDCLDQYLSVQIIPEWKCPKCKVPRQATKKCDFVRLPPIIIIHLNRFSGTDGIMSKKNTSVKCPLNNLNLRHYIPNNSNHNYNYNMYGLSYHVGGIHGGHYTAYCKNVQIQK